jgi:alanine racemase
LAEALEARLSLTVWRADHLDAASAAAGSSGCQAGLHVKVDSGMNRIGAPPAEALELIRRLRSLPGLVCEGVYTHFARADESDRTTTLKQHALFSEVVQSLETSGLRPDWVHAANTAASLAYPDARWNLIRSGVGIYGMQPSADVTLPSEFEPALQWKSLLTEVKLVPPGSGVSYGHIYVTRSNERIGTVPMGYADGFRRVDGNFVLVGGRRVPVVGRVCMDQCMVQLDAAPQARPGDEVVILGVQGGERIGAEEIGRRWGTINYEVTCGITERVARLYR